MSCVSLWFILFLLLSGVVAQDEGVQPFNRFGVVEAFWLPDAACELGAGWERIIFDWAQHQPNGGDDWNPFNVRDEWLQAAQACGREVVAVVKDTPAWATDGSPGIGVPRGLYLPVDDPGNLWASFMREAAAYYATRGVLRFIIWNEPDIEAGTYGYEFEGNVADYAQLVKVAYLAARDGNPEAQIHLGGVTYWHDVNAGRRLYTDRLLEALSADPDAAANGFYFDALTLHIYFRADTVYQIVGEMRDLLARYGLADKAIWITETNASPNLDPLWPVTRPQYQITLDEQSAFLVQAAALGLAAGADHIAVYKFFDWNLSAPAESWGLLRADETRRPAFAAWQTVIREFSRAQSAALAQNDAVYIVRLRREDADLYVAWARTADTVALHIGATGETAAVGDEYGNMMTMRAADGGYDLLLPGAGCSRRDGCPVGGNVTVLVQPTGETEVTIEMGQGLIPLPFTEARDVDGE